jgi:hypothetical protein
MWSGTERPRQASWLANKSIYLMTDSAFYLRSATKEVKKGVKLHILITMSAAWDTPSSQLKALLDRGAVIWVAMKLGPEGTMMVVDERGVLDMANKVSEWDRSLAEEYIKKWHNEVHPHWVIQCRYPRNR